MKCPHCGFEFETEIGGLNETELKQANDKVTAMIDAARTKQMRYAHREKIPEQYLALCDAYVEACGKDSDGAYNQEPNKTTLMEWLATLEAWKQARLTPDHIKKAYEQSIGKFPVGRPSALTVTAVAMKSKPTTFTPIPTVQATAEKINHPEEKYVKMPDEVREKLNKLNSKMEIR
jgi:hypothetical protein